MVADWFIDVLVGGYLSIQLVLPIWEKRSQTQLQVYNSETACVIDKSKNVDQIECAIENI